MLARTATTTLRLALPKGRMHEGVQQLLADAGIHLRCGPRDYRPVMSLPELETKVLKPRNIVEMLHHGSRELGFAGADWVRELDADLVELLDTEIDPVRLVAAAAAALLANGKLPRRRLRIASEYERITREWIARADLDAEFVRAYGATEVFPPEDADCIVDNTASGSTLFANGLEVVDELMASSTRLYAHPAALDDHKRRELIERFVLLLRGVLEARRRVMVEVNVTAECLEAVVAVLPCMREPTIAPLHGQAGFAVEAAVPRQELPRVVPEIKACGGTDILVTEIAQIVS